MSISVYDEATGLLTFPYVIERGERLEQHPIPLIGFRRHVMETREPLMIAEVTPEVAERYGNPLVLSGEPIKSALFVPLVGGGRVTGVVSLQNVDRTHAFSEDDQRLLTTLAGSLSVALDNARLLDESRQRVAELATVNSVGQALSSQLDLDALIELVGKKVRETFEADIAYVALHDRQSGRIDFPYYYERGQRRDEPSIAYGEGLTSRILESRAPLLLNRSPQFEEHEATAGGHPGTVLPGRSDPARRRRDRGHQRPEHRGGRSFRGDRLAAAGDDRRQRRRGDPERALVLRGGATAPVPGVARRHQSCGGGRHGRRRAGDRLEPGRRRAVRLLGRRGARPADRRPRLRRDGHATKDARSPGRR